MSEFKTAVELALERIDREKEKAEELQEQFTIEVMGIVRTYVDSCGLAPEVALALSKRKLWHALGASVYNTVLTRSGQAIMRAVIDEAAGRVARERGLKEPEYV